MKPWIGRAAAIGVVLAALLVVVRALYLWRAEIVFDEFQHLHAAYLVAQGETPYVDFFEHHTPLFYYVASPLLRLRSPDFDTILWMRCLSLGFGLLSVLIASWWACRLRGAAAGGLVGILMLANFFLFARGTILFLDVFACPFVFLSAILLSESRRRWRMLFASGLCAGVAILFTQKAVMAGFAVLGFFLAQWLHRGDGRIRGWLGQISAFVAGGAVAALSLPVMLGLRGLDDFFAYNVVMNMAWKARRFPAQELAALAGTDGAIYLLALAGLGARCCGLWKRRFRLLPEDVPALFLASLALGILLLPVVWSEYFVLVVNFAVLVAGLFLFDFASAFLTGPSGGPTLCKGRTRTLAILLIGACAAASIVDLFGRWLMPHRSLSTAALVAVLGLWGAIGCVLAALLRARSAAWPAAALALLLTFPVVEQMDFLWQQSNGEQRARVEFVLANTGPEDRVFDGYSGYGVFRPHAYWYWFLHHEVQLMLSDDERGPQVIDAIQQCRAPIVILDDWVKALPQEVQQYISENYAATEFPDIRVRIGGERP